MISVRLTKCRDAAVCAANHVTTRLASTVALKLLHILPKESRVVDRDLLSLSNRTTRHDVKTSVVGKPTVRITRVIHWMEVLDIRAGNLTHTSAQWRHVRKKTATVILIPMLSANVFGTTR